MINWTIHKSLDCTAQAHKVDSISALLILCHCETLNKLKNLHCIWQTSPFPIQLFHWFFLFFFATRFWLHSRKWENLKFNLKFIHTNNWLDSRQNYFFYVLLDCNLLLYHQPATATLHSMWSAVRGNIKYFALKIAICNFRQCP